MASRPPGCGQLGRERLAAFPEVREAAERWRAEKIGIYGEDVFPVTDDELPEIGAIACLPHLLRRVAEPGGEQDVRAVLDWVERAAHEHRWEARWLTSKVAEATMRSDDIELVYSLLGPETRAMLAEWVGQQERGLDAEAARIAECRGATARYRAISPWDGDL